MEAGLRSNAFEPFLQEKHHVLTRALSDWHFAPSLLEKEYLIKEQIDTDKIFITGSTVADAVHWILKNRPETNEFRHLYNFIIISTQQKGKNLRNICTAVRELAARFDDINFIFSFNRGI